MPEISEHPFAKAPPLQHAIIHSFLGYPHASSDGLLAAQGSDILGTGELVLRAG
jgi:hypothetical protein